MRNLGAVREAEGSGKPACCAEVYLNVLCHARSFAHEFKAKAIDHRG